MAAVVAMLPVCLWHFELMEVKLCVFECDGVRRVFRGGLCMNIAYRHAPGGAIVSPFHYSIIIMGAYFGLPDLGRCRRGILWRIRRYYCRRDLYRAYAYQAQAARMVKKTARL